MNSVIKYMEASADFHSMKGCNENDILSAEDQLSIHFAEDYKEYLQRYGVATFDGHEFTGICESERLNVVNITKEQQKLNMNPIKNMYVIEETHIDGIVIWQNEKGEIYITKPGAKAEKVAENMYEYYFGGEKLD